MTALTGRPVNAAYDVGGPEAAPAPADPRWARPALAALLTGTGLLYLVGLGASGWANAFYSAAVQAGSHSWKAWFFGSFDSSNFITVDKPPAALWVMGLVARVFGVSSWSILVPEALAGVGTVWLLYLAVRRHFGPGAGLLAGAAMAITPVSVLMFRFNNPDALLVLLLVGAAYAVLRAAEAASTRWLALAGALVGLGFLTKMLQAFVVVPVFALVYLVVAPTTLRRRLGQLLVSGAALLVAGGWWVAIVELWPASSRPYIGGSQTNSVLDLAFGYNGFGRITGNETGSVGGGAPGAAGRWGATGLGRMFDAEIGGQVSWFLPAALLLLGALLWLWWRRPRTDAARAQVLLWGGWLVLTGLVFSYMAGIFHPYYTVALAPGAAALVGIGAVSLWRRREQPAVRVALASAVAVTGVWAYVLLDRSPSWYPWLRVLVVATALGTATVLLGVTTLHRRAAAAVATAALLAGLAAPVAYAVETAATPHGGAIPSAGPAVSGGRGFGPGRPQRGGFGRFRPPGGRPPGGGAAGGLLDASTPSSELVALLRDGSAGYTWVAAAVGANSAAGFQLAADRPVMAIGGFNGTDPTPTLEQFQQLVRAGKVHYFLGGGGFGGRGGFFGGPQASRSSTEIADWVQQTFAATTVGGVTVYDLTTPNPA